MAYYQPEAIRAYCMNNYSETAIVQRLEGIYTQAIQVFDGVSQPL